MAKIKKTELERFEDKFTQTPGNGCWLWAASRDSFGYGLFSVANERRLERASRTSYRLYKGPIPEGLCVCHACDTPQCVNPSHLWLGTRSDNMKDAYNKKRMNRPNGVDHFKSKLTEEQVHIIRASTETSQALGDRYGCSKTNIQNIRSNKVWRYLPWRDSQSN